MAVRKEVEHKHIQWFVAGAVHEWNHYSGAALSGDRLQEYIGGTVNVVIGYLQGTRKLDGTCSDLQCTVSLEAEKVFAVTQDAAEDSLASTPPLDRAERLADGSFPKIMQVRNGVLCFVGAETGAWIKVASPRIKEFLLTGGWVEV